MARSLPLIPVACFILVFFVLSCGEAEPEPADTDDETLIERGQRYAESREFRRAILESSLENPDNLYSQKRLTNYAVDGESWESLPVFRPIAQPITASDFDTFDEQGRRESTYSGPADEWETQWDHEALLELGERAFESYPLRVDGRLAPVVESADNLDRVGLWRDDRDRIGGLVAQTLEDGTEMVAWTCSTCHASVREPQGQLVHGRANAMIDTGELYRLGGYDDSIVGAWRPGQIDSSQDGVDNPTAIPDLRSVRYQSHLHAAASIANDLMALTVRVETLLITSQMETARPPRQLAFAIAYYLWNMPLPPTETTGEEERAIFDENCSGCHYADGTVAAPVDYELVGTDPTAALSPARTTGRYRIPTLAGVGDRPYLLHDGSIRSLEKFMDPDRLASTPGHPFGLDLSQEERAAIIEVLKTLPADE